MPAFSSNIAITNKDCEFKFDVIVPFNLIYIDYVYSDIFYWNHCSTTRYVKNTQCFQNDTWSIIINCMYIRWKEVRFRKLLRISHLRRNHWIAFKIIITVCFLAWKTFFFRQFCHVGPWYVNHALTSVFFSVLNSVR